MHHHGDAFAYAWHFGLDALVVPLLLVAYVLAARRWRPSPLRATLFGAGLALILVAIVTPLHTVAVERLLTAHLLQNVILAEWAPGLLVAGLSPLLAARIGGLRGARWLLHPAIALALWSAIYAVWHLPVFYDAALRHHDTLLNLEHACYLVAGVLLWWPLLHATPHALTHASKALYALVAFVLASPLGLVLALLTDPIYTTYEQAPRLWGLSALEDQQLAGMTMAIEQSLILFAVFAVQLLRFLAEEEEAAPVHHPTG